MNKTLIIMRGLSGSGKSTLAEKMLTVLQTFGYSVEKYSADDFFMKDGIYTFNPQHIRYAHESCQDKTRNAMVKQVQHIIVDNTATQAWEIFPYINLAQKYGYEVEFHIPDTDWAWDVDECVKRNSHGVPRESIQRMKDRFQHNLTVEDILNYVK